MRPFNLHDTFLQFLFNLIREWKEKFDLVDDEAFDTLTYHFKNTFIFRPDLSGPGLTGDEIITMPHPCKLFLFLSLLPTRIRFILKFHNFF